MSFNNLKLADAWGNESFVNLNTLTDGGINYIIIL